MEYETIIPILSNISKGFTINTKKIELKGIVNFFSVDFNLIDTNDTLDIHRYLMKGKQYKIMFGIIKRHFIAVLSNIVRKSNHTKCPLLSNQKCMI